jgi:TusA-related sulfurtransferase
MGERFNADRVLDVQGLACPIPLVKTNWLMQHMEVGQVLEVLATDEEAVLDFQKWARDTKHELLGWMKEGEVLTFYLRKAGPGKR